MGVKLSCLIVILAFIFNGPILSYACAHVQIGANFFLICTRRSFCTGDGSTTASTTLAALPSADWHMCDDCGHRSPPRSHHCPLCRRCIAERDHHCFFTASCIGRDNRRHFVAFCFDCALGAGYALYVAAEYVTVYHPDDGGYARLVLPFALVRWVIGWQSIGSVGIVGFVYLCAMTSFGSAGIGLWQAFLIVRGETSYDFRCVSSTGGGAGSTTVRSVGRNIRSVCGPYWCLVFVVPWPLFKLPHDLDDAKML